MIVGIDPDKKKSGVAVFQNKQLAITSLSIVPLLDKLDQNKEGIQLVYLEAGWLNNAIHHKNLNKRTNGKIGIDVGINFGYGKVIESFLQDRNIPYKLIRPSKRTPKLDRHQFRKTTGYTKRTNQDERDAAMLIWRHEALRLIGGKHALT